jgi:hypothetical protein
MKYSPEQIEETLRCDPLHDAAKILGEENSPSVGALGLNLMMRKNEALDRMLQSTNDTLFSSTVEYYISVITRNGFKKVYEEPFVGCVCNCEPQQEMFYVFVKHPGLLLVFDTFNLQVNSGKIYYNWIPNPNVNCFEFTSSGCSFVIKKEDQDQLDVIRAKRRLLEWNSAQWQLLFKEEDSLWKAIKNRGGTVWSGDHDCREALIHNITRLAENGTFAEPWIKPPSLWLVTWGEKNNFDQVIKARYDKFPRVVKEMVGFEVYNRNY